MQKERKMLMTIVKYFYLRDDQQKKHCKCMGLVEGKEREKIKTCGKDCPRCRWQ